MNNKHITKCVTDWDDHPPIDEAILDSAGVRGERPLSTILRCYVLFDNGSLQVWTHKSDAMSLIMNELGKVLLVIAGSILGLIGGILIARFGKNHAGEPGDGT
jgi:hypothetical protein